MMAVKSIFLAFTFSTYSADIEDLISVFSFFTKSKSIKGSNLSS